MSRICPQCSQVNEEGIAFCRSCGYRFQGGESEVDGDATLIQPVKQMSATSESDQGAVSQSGFQQAQDVQPQPVLASFPPQPSGPLASPSLVATPQPSGIPAYPPPVTPPAPVQQPQGPFIPPPVQQGAYPPVQQVYGQPPYGTYGPPQMAQQVPAGSGLQRAFAGKGAPVHHQSWLLNGKGKQIQPATLRTSLIETIQKQGVLGVNVTPERLREQGVVLEERDYVRVQYGISSVFVYLAPMGQNIYASRTSTVQQPFSRTRIGVVIGLFVLMIICLLFYVFISPDPLAVDGGFGGGAKLFFSYAFDGLLFFYLFLLLRSFVFWLTDKDFWAFFRPNRINDFTLDALSCIELTTDKALRETLEQAGLDAGAITQPVGNDATLQTLRRF
ncbi:MAG TPA: hypothetical protein VKV19_00215 [Ktedonobacteraceae bacterium]|nr:hypothetical protein [Ktedonobacteraceae bacterium]